MFFHRAIGKVTFPIIAIAFVALSIQTTWQFLNDALPHETLVYKVLGLAVFELGAFCWFSLLTSGAENVLRTIIALIMTIMCVGGVATAAIYEVGSQMVDLGFKMDPAFLQWTPVCVLAGFVSTLVSTMLYMAASPHVAHRFAHLNATGQEPPIGSYMQQLPPTYVSPSNQIAGSRQQAALPAPKQVAAPVAPQVAAGGLRNRVGNFFSRLGLGLQQGNVQYTIAPNDASNGAAPVADAEPVTQDEDEEPAQGPTDDLVEVQYNVAASAPRTPARRRSSKARTTSAGGTRRGDLGAILDALDAANPGLNDAQLAKLAGCAQSSVSRWRKA